MADLERSQNSENSELINRKESLFSKIGSYLSGRMEDSDYLADPTKRNFLRTAAVLGTTAFLGKSIAAERLSSPVQPIQSPNQVEAVQSEEVEHKPSIPLIIDTFDDGKFYDDVIAAQAAARGIDAQSILDKFGITPDTTYSEIKEIQPTTPDERVILLLSSLKTVYGTHGEDVSKVRELTAQFLGETDSQVEHASQNNPITFDSLEFDEVGNPILWLVSSIEDVDQVVRQSQAPVINMSFQIGKVGMKYKLFKQVLVNPDMKPPDKSSRSVSDGPVTIIYRDAERNIISAEEYEKLLSLALEKEIVMTEVESERDLVPQDGYLKERAYQNLGNLADLASKYPDKIFVAAAGNPVNENPNDFPDLREAKEKLMQENRWPPNVFTVGYVVQYQDMLVPTQYGADFYVFHEDIDRIGKQTSASSYATPMVTEIVRRLQNQGITNPNDIRTALTQFSENINAPNGFYARGEQEQPFYMIDFSKVKNAFSPKNADEYGAI
ncbi:MAG: hypothetical protein WDZ94_01930 [Patescibacteria group bacterium]